MRRHNPQRGAPASVNWAWEEKRRSPQIAQVPLAMRCMPSKHSWHTGKRDTLTKGSPHIRQSEGKRTAKRFSASQRESRRTHDVWAAGAIEGPAAIALAWIARIRSPLLLKTASVIPARYGRLRAACLSPV